MFFVILLLWLIIEQYDWLANYFNLANDSVLRMMLMMVEV